MLNECHFIGNLTRDVESKVTGSGKTVCNFTIAVNRSFKRGTERVNEAAFLDMEAWDTGAELIAKHFSKGDAILVNCSVKQDNWENEDEQGNVQKRSKLKFRVNSFGFLPPGKKRDEDEPAQGEDDNQPPAKTKAKETSKKTQSKPSSSDDTGDEVPF